MADVNTTNFNLSKIEVGASENSWGAKNNNNFDEIDKALLGFYPDGGTANAKTITTGLSLTSIPIGMRVAFIADLENTGSCTLNVDGTGAATCKTVTGDNLPNGYIVTNQITEAIYNSAGNWIVERLEERGSVANGRFFRYPNGVLICQIFDVTLTRVSSGRMAYTWTFPSTFVDTDLVLTATLPSATGEYTLVDVSAIGHVNHNSLSTTGVSAGFSHAQAGTFDVSATVDGVRLQAVGRWY